VNNIGVKKKLVGVISHKKTKDYKINKQWWQLKHNYKHKQ